MLPFEDVLNATLIKGVLRGEPLTAPFPTAKGDRRHLKFVGKKTTTLLCVL